MDVGVFIEIPFMLIGAYGLFTIYFIIFFKKNNSDKDT